VGATLLFGVERSRRLFFPVAVASRFFLSSGCFAKSGTANGGGAFMQGVKHPQLLDSRSSRESLAQSAFAFPNAFEIELSFIEQIVAETYATASASNSAMCEGKSEARMSKPENRPK
jgi:hypothetical protein